MCARRVAFLLFTAAAGFADGQYVLRKEDAAKVNAAIDEGLSGGKLDCQIDHVKPFLDFAFRFEAGFVVRCPVRIFDGKAVQLAIYVRVTPATGGPVILGEQYRAPAIPPNMNIHTNLRRLNNAFEFSGGFALGEGDYTMDLLVATNTDRSLKGHWRVKAARTHGEEKVPVTMRSNTAGQLSSQPWDGKLTEQGHGLRVTVLLDAAPRDPNSPRLRVWDRTFLMDSVSSLLKQVPCESVRLVAFNLEQQREIFRDERFDRIGFRRLGRALRELELGTVAYGVLKHQHGWAEMLANLTNQEVQAETPSDLVIFLGPVTRVMQKIPIADLTPARSNSPRFFDFEYFPVWLGGGELPDAIYHLTTARKGTVVKIHSPGDLARGIERMLAQLPIDKVRTGS